MITLSIQCTVDGLCDISAEFFGECLTRHYSKMFPDCEVSVEMVHALRSTLTYSNDEIEDDQRTAEQLADSLQHNINLVFDQVCRGEFE